VREGLGAAAPRVLPALRARAPHGEVLTGRARRAAVPAQVAQVQVRRESGGARTR